MFYRFIYRDILKVDVRADTLRDAIEQLSARSPVFGIHPLDYDSFFLFDPDCDDD